MTNTFEAAAIRTQAQATAAWKDIQSATFAKDFPAAGMKALLANYEAARADEMEAVNAWKASL